MRKLLLVLLMCPVLGFGQSIKSNKIDKFTKERKIETSFEKITTGHFGGILKNVWVAINTEGEKVFLNVKWNTGAIVGVSEGAKLTFLSKSDKQFEFINRYREVSSKGAGTVGFVGAVDYGVNLYFDGDVFSLGGEELTDFRIETSDGYVDFKINKNNSSRISRLIKAIDKELSKTSN
jgi:hypothetical protein